MNRSVLSAMAIAAAVILWIASGLILGDDETAEATAPAAPENAGAPAAVRIVESQAQLTPRVVRVFGRTEADRAVTLKAETAAPVSAIEAEEGSRVGKGETIVRLAMEDRQSALEEAQKELKFREINFSAAEQLSKKQFSTEIGLAEAAAALARARAAVEAAELNIRHTRIEMPFDGVVDEISAEVGDVLDHSDPVAYVADLDPIVVTVGISERDISAVRTGHRARVRIVGREDAVGLVRFVSRSGNSETRTFKVEIAVENPDYAIAEGLTAEVLLEIDSRPAHRISPAALTLDDDGRLGVMTVTAADEALFQPVSIIRDEVEGIWVAGLDRAARIIVTGQEFVVGGQPVDPVVATD